MIELGSQHFDSVCKDEAALELPSRNATVEEGFFLGRIHPAANDQLLVFDGDAQVLCAKPCNRQGDLEVLITCVFDVVRRIRLDLAVPLEQPFDALETQ